MNVSSVSPVTVSWRKQPAAPLPLLDVGRQMCAFPCSVSFPYGRARGDAKVRTTVKGVGVNASGPHDTRARR